MSRKAGRLQSPIDLFSNRRQRATNLQGGTLRFVLDETKELHVWTTDLNVVATAIRWSKDGGGELLYK